jgi:hypothetical protein
MCEEDESGLLSRPHTQIDRAKEEEAFEKPVGKGVNFTSRDGSKEEWQ